MKKGIYKVNEGNVKKINNSLHCKVNVKQLKNIEVMLNGLQEIQNICDESIMIFPFPEQEAINRYEKILDILQNINDNLK